MATTVLPSSPLTFSRADRSGLRIALLSRVLGTGHLSTPARTRLPSLDAPAGPRVRQYGSIGFDIGSVTVGRPMVSSVPLRRLSKPRGAPESGSATGRAACSRPSTSSSWPSFCATWLPASASASNARAWLVRCNGQRVASRPRGMSRPRIMMEEPLAFRPTRWGQGLRADDSVPMGGRLAVGLVLSTGFGRGRRGAWVRRALREDGPAAVSGRHNERSLPVTGGFAAVAAFAFLRLFLAAAEQWLGDQGFGLVRPLAFLCHGIGPRR